MPEFVKGLTLGNFTGNPTLPIAPKRIPRVTFYINKAVQIFSLCCQISANEVANWTLNGLDYINLECHLNRSPVSFLLSIRTQ